VGAGNRSGFVATLAGALTFGIGVKRSANHNRAALAASDVAAKREA
jgi:hypothetical protein